MSDYYISLSLQSLSSWARIRNLILGRMSVIDEDLICTRVYCEVISGHNEIVCVSGSWGAGQDHQHNSEDNDIGQRRSRSEIHQRRVQSEDLRVLSDAGERFLFLQKLFSFILQAIINLV